MSMNVQKLTAFFNLKNTLIAVIVSLLMIAGNLKWQSTLRSELSEKRDEVGEISVLLKSETELKAREQEIKLLKLSQASSGADSWKDSIPSFVSEQKLILRQVRPLGIEQRGKLKEDKLLVQVEGDVKGVTGFLHTIGSSEMPIYVGQVSISTQTLGSGFVTAELVIAKPVFES